MTSSAVVLMFSYRELYLPDSFQLVQLCCELQGQGCQQQQLPFSLCMSTFKEQCAELGNTTPFLVQHYCWGRFSQAVNLK